MTKIAASLRLRPTRIGFLVRPDDMDAVRRVIRLCSCLWGGLFNPIIPVLSTVPDVWRRSYGHHLTGKQITEGYLRFFEPDVYVEASPNLAADAGVMPADGSARVIALDDFVSAEPEGSARISFGLEIFDLYRDLYNRAYRFVSRDEHRIALFEGEGPDMNFAEAVFGGYPDDERLTYIPTGFRDAFRPISMAPTPENWKRVIESGFRTPLDFTKHSLDVNYYGTRNPTLFVLDPGSSFDLLDFWNVRLFKRDVLALNLHWSSELKEFIRDFVKRAYRPLPGNLSGMMIETTLEFARSIPEESAQSFYGESLADTPEGSWSRKHWYDPIWRDDQDDRIVRPQRAMVTAATTRLELSVADDYDSSVRFSTNSPDFAERFGGDEARWANVLTFHDYGEPTGFALLLPSYLHDPHRSGILLGAEPLIVTREGWVLTQRFKEHDEYLRLPTGRDAITEWLKRKGVQAAPSDPGHIADQLLVFVRGIRGAHILADSETLKLLDKMAKSVRKQSDGTTEEYADRTASVSAWRTLLSKRANRRPWPRVELDDFVRAGALRLGLVLMCSNCRKQNWYGLTELAPHVECMRCLQKFEFPQGSLNFQKTPWRYRVAGPFAVPDYAGGAYATVLSLRLFARTLNLSGSSLTYSTNLDLKIGDEAAEVDFALWYRREHLGGGTAEEPAFVIGEAKSFAVEAFDSGDVARLEKLARKLPGTFLVFATLKDALSCEEKEQISKLACEGRDRLPDGRQKAPVIVLTGLELFAGHDLRQCWKDAGGQHAALVEHPSIRLDNLYTVADLTQQLYLELPGPFDR